MIPMIPGTKVYLACQPVSMRLGFDGLAARVAEMLAGDPFSGHLFLFRAKRADYLKVLYYDGTGLCLFANPSYSPHGRDLLGGMVQTSGYHVEIGC